MFDLPSDIYSWLLWLQMTMVSQLTTLVHAEVSTTT